MGIAGDRTACSLFSKYILVTNSSIIVLFIVKLISRFCTIFVLNAFYFADVFVRELEWNPEEPDLAIVCFSNGIISLLKIADHTVKISASLPSSNKYFSGSFLSNAFFLISSFSFFSLNANCSIA